MKGNSPHRRYIPRSPIRGNTREVRTTYNNPSLNRPSSDNSRRFNPNFIIFSDSDETSYSTSSEKIVQISWRSRNSNENVDSKTTQPPEIQETNDNDDHPSLSRSTDSPRLSNSQEIIPPQKCNENQEVVHSIIYDKRKLTGTWKRSIRCISGEINLFFSESKTTKYGKSHLICKSPPFSLNSPNLCAVLQRHKMGRRFTLYSPPINGNEFQLMGIWLHLEKLNGVSFKLFRVAIPESDEYQPSEKKFELSKVAKSDTPIEGVNVYSTAMPTITANGNIVLNFGHYSIKKSSKNFVVNGNDGNIIFLIYKKSKGILTVRYHSPPFTPLLSFAIGIAVITCGV